MSAESRSRFGSAPIFPPADGTPDGLEPDRNVATAADGAAWPAPRSVLSATAEVDEVVAELCERVAELRGDVRRLVDEEVRRLVPLVSDDGQRRIAELAVARLSGLGELETLLDDPSIDEVLVNAASDVWVDRAGHLERVATPLGQPVEHLIERILAPIGRRLDRTSPIVDARLGDGSRVCAVVPPVSVDGTCVSIRRFANVVRPIADFVDDAGIALLHEVVDARCNVVVTGATSSGKTSLLASMLDLLPDGERIVVLEDTAELPLAAEHAVRLEARPPSADLPTPIPLDALVRTALRLRPDRLVVGEVRGDEVLGLVQAMNTGHDGSFSTCHANGALDALLRLESLTLQAAPTWPLAAIREQLARSIDVIVHVVRNGERRCVGSVVEVGLERTAEETTTPTTRVLGALGERSFEVLGELTRRRR